MVKSVESTLSQEPRNSKLDAFEFSCDAL